MYSYTPAGVCSQQIFFDLDDGVVKNVRVGFLAMATSAVFTTRSFFIGASP